MSATFTVGGDSPHPPQKQTTSRLPGRRWRVEVAVAGVPATFTAGGAKPHSPQKQTTARLPGWRWWWDDSGIRTPLWGVQDIRHPVWVAAVQDACILGFDFLKAAGCRLNLFEGTVSFRGGVGLVSVPFGLGSGPSGWPIPSAVRAVEPGARNPLPVRG